MAASTMGPIALVVDTSFVISERELLENIRLRSKETGIVIVLPFALIKELDGLKRPLDDCVNSNQRDIRKAISWVYDQIANEEQKVRAQKYSEVFENTRLKGDESILDCCRYFREKKGIYTVLLSNDKNLCNLAIINEIPTVTGKKTMTADLVIATVLAHARQATPTAVDTKQHTETKSSVSFNGENDTTMNEFESSLMDRMDVDMDDIEVEEPELETSKERSIRTITRATDRADISSGGINPTLTITHLNQRPPESPTRHYAEGQTVGLEGSRHRSVSPQRRSLSPIKTMTTSQASKMNSISENIPPILPKFEPMSLPDLHSSMLSTIVQAMEDRLTQIYSKDLKYMYERPSTFRKLYEEVAKFWLPVFSDIVPLEREVRHQIQRNQHLTQNNRPNFVQAWSAFYLSIAKNPDCHLVEHWKTPLG